MSNQSFKLEAVSEKGLFTAGDNEYSTIVDIESVPCEFNYKVESIRSINEDLEAATLVCHQDWSDKATLIAMLNLNPSTVFYRLLPTEKRMLDDTYYWDSKAIMRFEDMKKNQDLTVSEKHSVSWDDIKLPINCYGDENNYKPFPGLAEELSEPTQLPDTLNIIQNVYGGTRVLFSNDAGDSYTMLTGTKMRKGKIDVISARLRKKSEDE